MRLDWDLELGCTYCGIGRNTMGIRRIGDGDRGLEVNTLLTHHFRNCEQLKLRSYRYSELVKWSKSSTNKKYTNPVCGHCRCHISASILQSKETMKLWEYLRSDKTQQWDIVDTNLTQRRGYNIFPAVYFVRDQMPSGTYHPEVLRSVTLSPPQTPTFPTMSSHSITDTMDTDLPPHSPPESSSHADDDAAKSKRTQIACLNCRKRKSRCLL